MPELPEVESIKLKLQKYLVGHKIENVEVRYGKNFEGHVKDLIGGNIKDVRRFGKVQTIDLDNDYSIVIHIKMTGQLIYKGPNLAKDLILSKKIVGGLGGKHTHVIFHLDRGGTLFYNDVRKFGWIHIHKTADVEKHKFISKLGPEPLKDLTYQQFKTIISKSSRPIKLVLMDQAKMGGVGNIYANDALWLSRIHPARRANNLKEKETRTLFASVEEVLKNGLKWGGSSELSYVTPDGSEGEYQNHTLAYGKAGEVCERCHKAKFEKNFLGGRGTYYCPNCQKLK